jgi:apolipoprotein N-acyltransferase
MKKNYLLALLSAFLLWLGWPPIPYSAPLLLVALVPLLWATENIIRGDYQLKGRKIFLTAGLAGFVWNTASIYWVFNAMHAIMPWYAAALIALIPFGLAAALIAIAFRLYYSLRKRYTLPISLAGLACFWIAYEYLHQTWELAFPWITLGNGFASTHQLVQWYEYTGVYGGTLWIWVCNILLFLFLLQRKQAPVGARRILWTLGLIVLIPMGISLLRYTNYEEDVNPWYSPTLIRTANSARYRRSSNWRRLFLCPNQKDGQTRSFLSGRKRLYPTDTTLTKT